ncbi:hypothetical protein GCM10020000_85840 [Streptomyces olivoverticillatus]
MRMDREYAACTFVVVGLELSRHAGVTGVAALAAQGEEWRPQWRVHARVAAAEETAGGPHRRAASRGRIRSGRLSERLSES